MRSTVEKYIAEVRVYRGNVSRQYYIFKSYNTPPLFIVTSGTPWVARFSIFLRRRFSLPRYPGVAS